LTVNAGGSIIVSFAVADAVTITVGLQSSRSVTLYIPSFAMVVTGIVYEVVRVGAPRETPSLNHSYVPLIMSDETVNVTGCPAHID
jgi:hypothetical protein